VLKVFVCIETIVLCFANEITFDFLRTFCSTSYHFFFTSSTISTTFVTSAYIERDCKERQLNSALEIGDSDKFIYVKCVITNNYPRKKDTNNK